MKTREKVLFIIGALLTVAALVLAALAMYFGVSALIAVHIHGTQGAESIGVAFMLVFLVIFAFFAWGTALLAAILLLVRPARTEHVRVRRWSRILLLVLLAVSVLLGVVFVLCL